MGEVYGADGNGGKMLKIISDLSDEEMARLKHVRRLAWHWKGSRKYMDGREQISDQELSDRGISMPQEPYVEYMKRPPHDKYLWAKGQSSTLWGLLQVYGVAISSVLLFDAITLYRESNLSYQHWVAEEIIPRYLISGNQYTLTI